MCMVRSPKSIAGAVGATLGNAPYKIAIATFWIVAEKCQVQRFVIHYLSLSVKSIYSVCIRLFLISILK